MSQAALIEQWSLLSMQVINWGGFNGSHTLWFAPPGQGTVISGKSGSGKSTLLDANTVLMHHGNPLNKASNDAGRGGRSELSYVRGYRDKKVTRSSEQRLMLRGSNRATWSAIGQTWRNADGTTFTLFALFYARPGEQLMAINRYGHAAGALDLNVFEQYVKGVHAKTPLKPATIQADHPTIKLLSNPKQLRLWFLDRIGVQDVGKRLMTTLYRIQTSGEIGSVHDLFQELVLDEPSTLLNFVNESRALWAETRKTYENVEVVEDKARRLAPITEIWEKYQANIGHGSFLDQIDATKEPGPTPFWRWVYDHQADLLEVREAELRDQAESDRLAAVDTAQHHTDLRAEWLSALQDYQRAGGADIDAIEKEIDAAKATVDNVRNDRRHLQGELSPTIQLPITADDLATQQAASTAFETAYPRWRDELEKPLKDLQSLAWRAGEDLKKVRADLSYYRGRRDLIPQTHTEVRADYAAASGIPIGDLRFVGELVDVKPEWEKWRKAADITIGSFALTLLIPQSQAARFTRAIGRLETSRRIRHLEVPDRPAPSREPSPQSLAGRLTYSEHKYSAWLADIMANKFPHTCVPDSAALADLPRGEWGVTPDGQVREANGGGAHGGQATYRPAIGFSVAALIATLEQDETRLIGEADLQQNAFSAAQKELGDLDAAHRAHGRFLQARETWKRYDLPAAEKTLRAIEERKERLETDNNVLALKAAADQLENAEKEASTASTLAQKQAEATATAHTEAMEAKDQTTRKIDALSAAGVQPPDGASMGKVIESWRPGVNLTLEHLQGQELRNLGSHVRKERDSSKRHTAVYRDELAGIFRGYLDKYKTPILSDDPDLYYEDFARLREQFTLTGLSEAKAKFAQHIERFTTMTTSTIRDRYEDAQQDIRDRLSQINSLLAQQDFHGRNRLQIVPLREQMPEETREFLDALSTLGSRTTKGVDYDDLVQRYQKFENFMAYVATDKDVERLFDVRQPGHIYLHAEEQMPDGEHVTHDVFEEKSGGEYQELYAFVLAAALRYQVGSDGDQQPRVAPVFLDEGMIKADPEVTERAVSVWTKLGFQPILAVPLDKHESVMVAAHQTTMICKDDNGLSRIDTSWKKDQTGTEATA